MTKSTFNDILFLGVLNCFYTLCWKGETCQGFPNSTKGLGEKSPLPVRRRGWEILLMTGIFSLGAETFFKDKNNLL